MVVDRMQGLRVSLPFQSLCSSLPLSCVRLRACVRACVFVRLFVRLSTMMSGNDDRDEVGVGGEGVAKNHALVEAFYYRT